MPPWAPHTRATNFVPSHPYRYASPASSPHTEKVHPCSMKPLLHVCLTSYAWRAQSGALTHVPWFSKLDMNQPSLSQPRPSGQPVARSHSHKESLMGPAYVGGGEGGACARWWGPRALHMHARQAGCHVGFLRRQPSATGRVIVWVSAHAAVGVRLTRRLRSRCAPQALASDQRPRRRLFRPEFVPGLPVARAA